MRRKMTMTSWLLGGTTLVVLAIAMVPIVVTWIESRQAQTVGQLEPVAVSGTISHHTAVVIYFSRSGNTALAARHLANQLHAPIVELKATDYELGLSGWVHAMKDARGHHSQHHRSEWCRHGVSWLPHLAIQPSTSDLGVCSSEPLGWQSCGFV